MPDKTAVNQMVSVLDLLTKYGLLDSTGHIVDCPYTDETPDCYCAQFGKDVHEALLQKSNEAKMATDVQNQIDLLKRIERLATAPYSGVSDRKRSIIEIRDMINRHIYEIEPLRSQGRTEDEIVQVTNYCLTCGASKNSDRDCLNLYCRGIQEEISHG